VKELDLGNGSVLIKINRRDLLANTFESRAGSRSAAAVLCIVTADLTPGRASSGAALTRHNSDSAPAGRDTARQARPRRVRPPPPLAGGSRDTYDPTGQTSSVEVGAPCRPRAPTASFIPVASVLDTSIPRRQAHRNEIRRRPPDTRARPTAVPKQSPPAGGPPPRRVYSRTAPPVPPARS
jgi:hypothetical protein